MHSTRCPFTPVPGTPHTAHCPLDATKHPASGAPPFRGINWREGKRCRQSRQAGQRPPDAQRDAEHFEFVRLLAGGLPAASAELAAAQATRRCSSHIVTSTSSAEARLACDQRKLGPMKAQKKQRTPKKIRDTQARGITRKGCTRSGLSSSSWRSLRSGSPFQV